MEASQAPNGVPSKSQGETRQNAHSLARSYRYFFGYQRFAFSEKSPKVELEKHEAFYEQEGTHCNA